jgi:hypothetical protein
VKALVVRLINGILLGVQDNAETRNQDLREVLAM